jgi:hypothetical protein
MEFQEHCPNPPVDENRRPSPERALPPVHIGRRLLRRCAQLWGGETPDPFMPQRHNYRDEIRRLSRLPNGGSLTLPGIEELQIAYEQLPDIITVSKDFSTDRAIAHESAHVTAANNVGGEILGYYIDIKVIRPHTPAAAKLHVRARVDAAFGEAVDPLGIAAFSLHPADPSEADIRTANLYARTTDMHQAAAAIVQYNTTHDQQLPVPPWYASGGMQ